MPSTPAPSNTRIPLSPWEDLFWQIEDRFGGAGREAVIARIKGSIEVESLQTALRNAQRRHPRLRSRVLRGTDQHLYFDVREEDVELPLVLHDQDDEEMTWQEETHRCLSAPLDLETGPPARVVVLRSRSRQQCVLIIAVHHAIADGLSLISLLGDVLNGYEQSEQKMAPEPIDPRPMITARRASSSGNLFRKLALMVEILRFRRFNHRGAWTSLPAAEGVPPPVRWVHWVFSAKDSLVLARRCRKENVSLTTTLFAACIRGLMTCLPSTDPRFKCRFPIDIRRYLDSEGESVSHQDLGCFVSGLDQIFTPGGAPSLWEIAGQAQRDIDLFVSRGGPSLLYNLINSVRITPSEKKMKRGTLFVSNYGMANLRDQYGSLQLEGCTLNFNRDEGGPSLVMQALILQQHLNLGFSVIDVPEAFWQQLQAAICKELRAGIGIQPESSL